MGTLTVGQLRIALKGLPKNTVVIIGNDDELNGVHNAWYAQTEEVSNVKLQEYGETKTYDGDIMDDTFNIHLGHKKEKNNNKKILLIS